MHCYEQTTFTEKEIGYKNYTTKFRHMKGSIKNLRNTADVAALIVTKYEDNNKCGAGFFGIKGIK